MNKFYKTCLLFYFLSIQLFGFQNNKHFVVGAERILEYEKVISNKSIGLLVNDILSLAKSKLKDLPDNIMASGGGARPSLLQFISDLTGITVHRSPMKDRTALGVHALLNKTHKVFLNKQSIITFKKIMLHN